MERRQRCSAPADTPHEIRIFEYQDYLRRDRPFGKAICNVVDHQAFERVNGISA
jgi:hypothetical protein